MSSEGILNSPQAMRVTTLFSENRHLSILHTYVYTCLKIRFLEAALLQVVYNDSRLKLEIQITTK